MPGENDNRGNVKEHGEGRRCRYSMVNGGENNLQLSPRTNSLYGEKDWSVFKTRGWGKPGRGRVREQEKKIYRGNSQVPDLEEQEHNNLNKYVSLIHHPPEFLMATQLLPD